MAAVKTARMTKSMVLAEIKSLREKAVLYGEMSDAELRHEYRSRFASFYPDDKMTRANMVRSLTLSDTYHLTNVLGLE